MFLLLPQQISPLGGGEGEGGRGEEREGEGRGKKKYLKGFSWFWELCCLHRF